MVYRIKTFFGPAETPPVMGSLELSLVPHSVKESRRLLLIPSRFWYNWFSERRAIIVAEPQRRLVQHGLSPSRASAGLAENAF